MSTDTQKENAALQKAALRARIRRFYRHFDRQQWPKCYETIDPKLRNEGKVDFAKYQESLAVFAQHYGKIEIWHIDLSSYLDAKNNKRDDRPFAYAYIFWKDNKHSFHVFRERWVRDNDDWYTRVVGLVTHETNGEKLVE